MTVEPHPYQVEVNDAVDRHTEQGYTRLLVQMPTGTGKTFTQAFYIRRLMQRRPRRVLWLAHRTELLEQARRTLRAVLPDAEIGVVQGARDEYDAEHVVIASVQTMYKRWHRTGHLTNVFDHIVVDEAHHAPADTYQTILGHYLNKTTSSGDRPTLNGLTATPKRADGLTMEGTFECIAYEMTIGDAIEQGYLCPISVRPVCLPGLDLSKVEVTRQGDYNEEQLAKELLKAGVAEATAGAIFEHAPERKTLVFTVSVDQAQRTAEELRALGLSADWVAGSLPRRERKKRLAALENGNVQVMCSAMILTEGYDCPSVDCIAMARVTRSRGLYIQCAGRGLRLHPGKADCLIIDITGAHGDEGLTAETTLKGKERKDADEDEKVQKARLWLCSNLDCTDLFGQRTLFERDEVCWVGVPPKGPGFCTICASPVTDGRSDDREMLLLESYLQAAQGSADPSAKSVFDDGDFAWVECQPGLYALSLGLFGQAAVFSLSTGDWAVEALPRGKGAKPRSIGMGALLSCKAAAEDHAKELGVLGSCRRHAAWRRQWATEGLLGALAKWRIRVEGRKWTKGAASDEMMAAIVRARYRTRMKAIERKRKAEV